MKTPKTIKYKGATYERVAAESRSFDDIEQRLDEVSWAAKDISKKLYALQRESGVYSTEELDEKTYLKLFDIWIHSDAALSGLQKILKKDIPAFRRQLRKTSTKK